MRLSNFLIDSTLSTYYGQKTSKFIYLVYGKHVRILIIRPHSAERRWKFYDRWST